MAKRQQLMYKAYASRRAYRRVPRAGSGPFHGLLMTALHAFNDEHRPSILMASAVCLVLNSNSAAGAKRLYRSGRAP